MATTTQFVWDEAKQCNIPVTVETIIETVDMPTPVKTRKGRTKKFNYERVMVGGFVAKDKVAKINELMPQASNTDIINLAIDLLLADLESNTEV